MFFLPFAFIKTPILFTLAFKNISYLTAKSNFSEKIFDLGEDIRFRRRYSMLLYLPRRFLISLYFRFNFYRKYCGFVSQNCVFFSQKGLSSGRIWGTAFLFHLYALILLLFPLFCSAWACESSRCWTSF
jgi:hypothetical protein